MMLIIGENTLVKSVLKDIIVLNSIAARFSFVGKLLNYDFYRGVNKCLKVEISVVQLLLEDGPQLLLNAIKEDAIAKDVFIQTFLINHLKNVR